jgi:triacylglycerol lipase
VDVGDARYAVLALIAEDMFGLHPELVQPPADPRLAIMGYTLVGHVTAVDQVFSFGRARVCYGFCAVAGDHSVLVFRGTERAIEWAKDAEGVQVAHPIAGKVHAGFWNIYDSARLVMASGVEQPLIAATLEGVRGSALTIAGHSLGGPLATYAAYDVASMHPEQVAARLFASPRPGDLVFSDAASIAIKDHVGYVYEPDAVPKVPFGFNYAPLTNLIEIPKSPRVRGGGSDLGANHHAWIYAWLIDPSTAEAALIGAPEDKQYAEALEVPPSG